MSRSADRDAIRRLERGLDRWGSRLERWPLEERRAAERLLAADDEARRHLAAAQAVDAALLDLMRPETAGRPALRLALPVLPSRPSYRRLATWSSIGLAASLLLGFALGTVLPAPDADVGRSQIVLRDADAAGDVL